MWNKWCCWNACFHATKGIAKTFTPLFLIVGVCVVAVALYSFKNFYFVFNNLKQYMYIFFFQGHLVHFGAMKISLPRTRIRRVRSNLPVSCAMLCQSLKIPSQVLKDSKSADDSFKQCSLKHQLSQMIF